ncbi:hypothetical protein H072_11255 [Dactylellina haptotyla CBS 200.50]|uniref:DUF8004 domain-containing protein n=1 Tax=Dactylellina haptotyla (strain CBS 200.50) TaxID=1284197 RepID=S8B8M9_DACHA|nr:hypothetical protein H072_11255 [Dactylellina haptotyla CBS 200.50]
MATVPTTLAPATDAAAGSTSGSFFGKKGSRSIFSKPKDSANDKPKSSRPSFFQNLKASRTNNKIQKDKGKALEKQETEVETSSGGHPDHPAYGLPGEILPTFGGPSKHPTAGTNKDLANLVDLEGHQQPGWRPLFGVESESEVPDSQSDPGSFERPVDIKGKGKASAHLTRRASEDSFLSPAESVSKTPGGLPPAYQIISGKDARKSPHYNYASLYNGRPVRELWNPDGDTLIYLCAKNSATPHGPSFFVDSLILQSTSDYWVVAFSPVWQGGFDIPKSKFPTAKYALFFAPDRPDGKNEETDALTLLRHYITMRNVFACMFDSFCVGLIEDDSPLLSDLVDRMLMYFDGAEDSLGQKLSEFIIKSGLWDVSNDAIKAIDLLHLAATYQMKDLYLEAFVHSVGMWPQIQAAKAHEVLSEPIVNLLIDRHNEIDQKVKILSSSLKSFQFKELWKVKSPATKLPLGVRKGYQEIRTFLYKYYTSTSYPKWPPKNLNTRPVLLHIYEDFCALYALLVDRQYTTSGAVASYHSLFHYANSLRLIDQKIAKHGKSMPFGIPILPGYFFQPIGSEQTAWREQEAFIGDISEKPSDAALEDFLPKLYNHKDIRRMGLNQEDEGITVAFMGFEKSIMRGKSLKAMAELRKGMWMVIYGVMSLMAELSVESGTVFKDEVEYLLCCDTTDVFEWEGKRLRPARAAANPDDPDMDRWSVASLEETDNARRVRFEGGGGSGSDVSVARGASGAAAEGKNRAELSYPWVIAQTPGWALGNQSGTGT